MAYSEKFKESILNTKKNPGNLLGRWSIHLGFSALRMAKATGATRQTVYNWFLGGTITQAYQARTTTVLSFLRSCRTADEAWEKICKHFDLKH